MNKFKRFLGRISAEVCLKMDYFKVVIFKNCQVLGVPLQNPLLPAAGDFASRPRSG